MAINLAHYTTGDYDPGPLGARVCWLVVSRVLFETRFPWPSKLKAKVLRLFGASIGEGVVVKPSVKIKYPWFLSIGDHCWVGERVWIDNLVRVSLADQVVLSQEAYLMTGNHNYKSSGFDLMPGTIEVEGGAWIGARSMVCPGIKVGGYAVLSAGSVASNDLEDYGIYVGNPCEKKRVRVIE